MDYFYSENYENSKALYLFFFALLYIIYACNFCILMSFTALQNYPN